MSHPLLLLLCRRLICRHAVTAGYRSRRLGWHDARQGQPFLAVVVAGLPISLLSGEEKSARYHQFQQGMRPTLLKVVDPCHRSPASRGPWPRFPGNAFMISP